MSGVNAIISIDEIPDVVFPVYIEPATREIIEFNLRLNPSSDGTILEDRIGKRVRIKNEERTLEGVIVSVQPSSLSPLHRKVVMAIDTRSDS